jgi:F-type H+-transporting ATPase subunit gamma
MPVSPRLIKRRIKSVGNTRKITKAMELVAASKMRKSVQRAIASRAYAGTVNQLVENIRSTVDPALHPFLSGLIVEGNRARTQDHPVTLLIVASSDRGLCGGFNAQLLKKALQFIQPLSREHVRIITVGHRADSAVRRAGYEVLGSFAAISNAPSFDGALPVGRLAINEFLLGSVQRIFMAFTDFQSALTHVPRVEQILPVIPLEEFAGRNNTAQQNTQKTLDRNQQTPNPNPLTETLFEPKAEIVLDVLLPKLVETRIYQALLESSASEHAARMMAMRNATDNATSMLEDLTFTYNQARQAGITREISEISAGKAALE